MVEPRIRRILDRVYLASFDAQYDLNMHFLRLQEFYESPDDRFRGRSFTLLEYMRWYALERPDANGGFSYISDWSGFNLPGRVMTRLYDDVGIADYNPYDHAMRVVYDTVKVDVGDDGFYLIGVVEGSGTLEHELAHGLWATSPEYRTTMEANIAGLDVAFLDTMRQALRVDGYCDDVLDDEVNAYMATGIAASTAHVLSEAGFVDLTTLRKPFVEAYSRFSADADMPWRASVEHDVY